MVFPTARRGGWATDQTIQRGFMKKQNWSKLFSCIILTICFQLIPLFVDGEEIPVRQEFYEERILFQGEYGTGLNQLRQTTYDEFDPEILKHPCMTVAPNGTILIADQFNGLIKRFSDSGEVLQTIPIDSNVPYILWISVDSAGNIYYLMDDTLWVGFNSDGKPLEAITLQSEGLIAYSEYLKLSNGNIYYINPIRGMLRYEGLKFDRNGILIERRPKNPFLWATTGGEYFVQTDSTLDYRDILLSGIRKANGDVFLKDAKDHRVSFSLGVDRYHNLNVD